MKGIILAGGSGTRLYPSTYITCKQLLPVYDKPLIYYPVSTLMLAGIMDILIISTPKDTPQMENLLGDGLKFGISISYAVQEEPKGLADAFIIGEEFIGNDSVCLILGDNIFYGNNFRYLLSGVIENLSGATIFGYPVQNPKQFGVVEYDKNMKVVSLEEKPEKPKSNMAIVGLYFYDNTVVQRAKSIIPSERGEIEITDLNNSYLNDGLLNMQIMGRGYAWLDTGTPQSMLEAANFIKIFEDRQGYKISCIEEIAYNMNYINIDQLKKLGMELEKSVYGQYILSIVEEHSQF